MLSTAHVLLIIGLGLGVGGTAHVLLIMPHASRAGTPGSTPLAA